MYSIFLTFSVITWIIFTKHIMPKIYSYFWREVLFKELALGFINPVFACFLYQVKFLIIINLFLLLSLGSFYCLFFSYWCLICNSYFSLTCFISTLLITLNNISVTWDKLINAMFSLSFIFKWVILVLSSSFTKKHIESCFHLLVSNF